MQQTSAEEATIDLLSMDGIGQDRSPHIRTTWQPDQLVPMMYVRRKMIMLHHLTQSLLEAAALRLGRINRGRRIIIAINLTTLHVLHPAIPCHVRHSDSLPWIGIQHREEDTAQGRRLDEGVKEEDVWVVSFGYRGLVGRGGRGVLGVPLCPAAQEIVIGLGVAFFGFVPQLAAGGHAEHYYGCRPDI